MYKRGSIYWGRAEEAPDFWSKQARREKGHLSNIFSISSFYYKMVSWKLDADLFITFLKQESKFMKFLGFMWNPLSWVMEFAAIMAIGLANGGVSSPPLLSSLSHLRCLHYLFVFILMN